MKTNFHPQIIRLAQLIVHQLHVLSHNSQIIPIPFYMYIDTRWVYVVDNSDQVMLDAMYMYVLQFGSI